MNELREKIVGIITRARHGHMFASAAADEILALPQLASVGRDSSSQSQPSADAGPEARARTEAEPSGAVGAALAMVDAAEAVCPINSGRSNAEHCPKCGATSSQNCGPVATAHDALANAVRAALAHDQADALPNTPLSAGKEG